MPTTQHQDQQYQTKTVRHGGHVLKCVSFVYKGFQVLVDCAISNRDLAIRHEMKMIDQIYEAQTYQAQPH